MLEDLDMMEGGEQEDYEEDVRRKFYIMMAFKRGWRMRNTDRTRLRWEELVEELTDVQFRKTYRNGNASSSSTSISSYRFGFPNFRRANKKRARQ